MSERDQILLDIPIKLQQLNDFGKIHPLHHALRNQLNGLSLAFQTLLLQAELNLPVDQGLMSLSIEQWKDFVTLRETGSTG